MKYIELIYSEAGISHGTIEEITGDILKSKFDQYGKISIAFSSDRILKPIILDQGFGGIKFEEHQIQQFDKDYDGSEKPGRWINTFDLTNWVMLVVINSKKHWMAGAVIAMKTKDVHLLRGRDDLAVLWDIRVNHEHRGVGIGRLLFSQVISVAKTSRMTKLHIETQNNNYGACRFYSRMGCHLIRIDMDSYPDLPEEVQLLWQYDLI